MSETVSVRIENDQVVITGSMIMEWDHSLFFEVFLNAKADYDNQSFFLTADEEIFSVLIDIKEHFDDAGIEIVPDEQINSYLSQINNENDSFKEALILSKQPQEIALPVSFTRKLYDFQKKGVNHLLTVKNGANFSVPGSGKTSVIYAAFSYLRENGEVEKLLVIGPISSFMPWEDEAKECFSDALQIRRLLGSKAERKYSYNSARDFDVFLCSFQTASNDINQLSNLLKKFNFLMVIDESHYIKKIKDGVWANNVLKLSRFAQRRAIMSGTPMPNSLEDLWTQFTFLWPGEQVLGDRYSYSETVKKKKSLEIVRKKVSPFIFRVRKQDLKLPDKNFTIHQCEMNSYQAEIYKAIAIRLLRQLRKLPEEINYLRKWRRAKLVRLLQTASNPTLLNKYSEEFDVPRLSGENVSLVDLIDKYPKYETPGKFIYLQKLIEQFMQENKKIVLWTSFIHNIKTLEALFHEYPVFKIYGEIPKDDNEDQELNREQQIRDFHNIQSSAILIANPAACAESISLHKASNNVVYLDRTFNAGQYLQSIDRTHRIGSEREVNYHLLLSTNSIDEIIHERLLKKENRMLSILDGEFPAERFDVLQHPISSDEELEEDFNEVVKSLKMQYHGKENI